MAVEVTIEHFSIGEDQLNDDTENNERNHDADDVDADLPNINQFYPRLDNEEHLERSIDQSDEDDFLG